jgi:PilZ domain
MSSSSKVKGSQHDGCGLASDSEQFDFSTARSAPSLLVARMLFSARDLFAALLSRKNLGSGGERSSMLLSRNYLRRRDARRRVMFAAILECRDVAQRVRIVDFSASGVRTDGIKGLSAGDPVRIFLTPEFSLEGQVAWVVWHKAGIRLMEPLDDNHPAYLFLIEQAEAIERTRSLALASLAQDKARR